MKILCRFRFVVHDSHWGRWMRSYSQYSHYTHKKIPLRELMGEHWKGKRDEILPSGVPASVVSVNIIQNGSFGFSRSVYLATDHAVYLFNCPESNRRLLSEHGIHRIPFLRHVFFTYGGWDNVSGFAGLAAFQREVGLRKCNLHGPIGMERIVNVARTFGDNPRVDCNEKPILEEHGLETYDSSTVNIECVPFTASPEKEALLKKYLDRKIESRDRTMPIRADDVAVAYICKLKPKFGKIILDKCMERGIQIGPAIGALQRGLVTKNRFGEDVHPDEVREPPLPPRFFAVIECPKPAFLDALIRAEPFHQFQTGGNEELSLMVHLSPRNVMESEPYRDWMNRFPSTDHWICNESTPPICHLEGAYKAQIKMNRVHEEIFPLLWHHNLKNGSKKCVDVEEITAELEETADGNQKKSGVASGDIDSEKAIGARKAKVDGESTILKDALPKIDCEQSVSNDEQSALKFGSSSISTSDFDSGTASTSKSISGNLRLAEPFTKFAFRPPDGFQSMRANEGSYDIEDQDELPKPLPLQTIELEKFKKEAASIKLSGDRFPIITFLGTAAAAPTKYRNVSGIMIDLEDHVSIMFDCGESTLSQFQLLYGLDSVADRLIDLKAVFITHLHLDHHFGLYSLILERKSAFEKLNRSYEKLIVLAASPLLKAHKSFSGIVQDVTELCEFHSTALGPNLEKSKIRICQVLGLRDLDVAKTVHPQCATGFVAVTKDGKKVVYSGDTRPSEELINKGMGADLLIHEATMNDGWEREAIFKKHCTKSEAIQVGQAMKARWTILTHFTAMNTKLPYMEDEVIKANPTVGITCDFMRIRWEQLELVPKLVPVIFEMHRDGIAEQAEKGMRKRLEQIDQEEGQEKKSKIARRK